MKLFFGEIGQFFQTKSIYRVLFLVIVFCYALLLFMGKVVSEKHTGKEAAVDKQAFHEAFIDTDMISKKLAEHPDESLPIQILIYIFGVLFWTGIALNVIAFRRFQRTGDWIRDAGYLSLVSWGIADILKVTILFFSASLFLNVLLGILHLLVRQTASEILLLIHAGIVDVLAVGFIIYTVKKSGAEIRDLIGWRWSKIPWREIWLGIGTYIAILPTLLVLIVSLVMIANHFSYEPPAHPLVHVFMREEAPSPWLIGFSLVLACVIGPVVEEIFFRGFFYPALKRYFTTGWVMIMTAALFALVHENLFTFAPIFFLGFMLCYLYEKRSSIIAPIFLHITHNVVFLGYFFLVKKFVGAGFLVF